MGVNYNYIAESQHLKYKDYGLKATHQWFPLGVLPSLGVETQDTVYAMSSAGLSTYKCALRDDVPWIRKVQEKPCRNILV